MPTINTDVLDKYQLGSNNQNKDPNKILQGDFLKLMTTQLQNQDPMKPTDNGEFLGQMAQFSTVSGLNELQESFASLANSLQSNQALLAATLIDKKALVPTSQAQTITEGEKISGALAIPASTSNAWVNVLDAGGNVIRKIELGGAQEGLKDFSWDGKDKGGSEVAIGNYSFQGFFQTGSKDQTEAASMYLNSTINSISLDQGQISINTQDGATHGFSDILRVG